MFEVPTNEDDFWSILLAEFHKGDTCRNLTILAYQTFKTMKATLARDKTKEGERLRQYSDYKIFRVCSRIVIKEYIQSLFPDIDKKHPFIEGAMCLASALKKYHEEHKEEVENAVLTEDVVQNFENQMNHPFMDTKKYI